MLKKVAYWLREATKMAEMAETENNPNMSRVRREERELSTEARQNSPQSKLEWKQWLLPKKKHEHAQRRSLLL